jgi:hypothetical protein
MSDTLFDGDQSSAPETFVGKLVAAKGETWSDPETIAKGYLAAQQHIDTLESERNTAVEAASKNDYMTEGLDRIEAGKAKPVSGEPASENTGTSATDNQGITVEQIKGLVAETLTAQEAERTATQNLGETKSRLAAAFGTEAGSQLEKAMATHGMTKQRMDQLASESPTAFMALMGAPTQKQTNSLAASSVNSVGDLSRDSGKQDWAYWQKMRRENPKQYRDSSTQKRMLEARESMSPEDFYGTS